MCLWDVRPTFQMWAVEERICQSRARAVSVALPLLAYRRRSLTLTTLFKTLTTVVRHNTLRLTNVAEEDNGPVVDGASGKLGCGSF